MTNDGQAEPGDPVVDRATGRRMTVVRVLSPPVLRFRVECEWYDGGRRCGLFKDHEIRPAE